MLSPFQRLLVLLLVLPASLSAQPAPDLAAELTRHLTARADAQAQAMNAILDVQFDAASRQRLDHAPCLPTINLPANARLWGRLSIPLRCPESGWHALVQASVRLMASAPLLVRPVSAGHLLQASDWALADIDLAAYPRGVLTDETLLIGNRTRRPLRAGSPIPPDALSAGPATQAGQTVRVVLVGAGFVIKSQAKAIGRATPGQALQVELDSGQRVTGTMNDRQEVEIRL